MAELTPPVGNDDHAVGGSAEAAVTLVEYGDYQCPVCGRAYGEIKKAQEALGENLRFVYRNFPLSTMHEHAENAAEAAEIANQTGKFWEMHDILFENQQALTDDDLAAYAEAIGIDRNSFVEELSKHSFEPNVHKDFRSGARSGVNGTPTFFINGQRYDGRWEHGSLRRALQEVLDN